MTSRVVSVIDELPLDGAQIQVVDYRWRAGERVVECYSDYILCYRAYPSNVSILPQISDSGFGPLEFFPAGMEVKSLPALRSEKTSTILFRFSKDWFNEICSGTILEALNFEHKAHFFDMKNWRIEQCLRRLGAEATSPGFATRMLAEALSVQLAIELGRHFNDDLETFRLQTVGGHISESYVSMIREYVESCENMCPKIGDIAQLCKTSSAHLRRSFKQTTGMTLHQFVAEIRLRKAQVLLAETDHPLKVISYRLGFSDPSTFSSTFGRHMKMSPSDFRNVGRG